MAKKKLSGHQILKGYWPLYLLVVPSFILIAVFMYYPAVSAVYHAFFRWDGSFINEYVGLHNFKVALTDRTLGYCFIVIAILVVANLFKMIPSMATAVFIHRLESGRWRYIYRVLFVVPMIIPGMVVLLMWKFFYEPNVGLLNKILNGSGLMKVLQWVDGLFGWGIFVEGLNPVWLSEPKLVLPALIFWGFPWIGIVGVLIYLAGLDQIPQSVYEQAEIDGASWWRKFWSIELPLIMTQVRLNLILMIIGTLQGYGLILVLFGPYGGAGGKANVPGLYMYYNAFIEKRFGYACAIGMLLFVLILILTVINIKFVRVEK